MPAKPERGEQFAVAGTSRGNILPGVPPRAASRSANNKHRPDGAGQSQFASAAVPWPTVAIRTAGPLRHDDAALPPLRDLGGDSAGESGRSAPVDAALHRGAAGSAGVGRAIGVGGPPAAETTTVAADER